jgi:hypothetical protein
MNREKTGGPIACASFALLAAVGGAIGARDALAQDARAVTVDVGDCVKIEAPDERLACYGRQVDAAVKRSSAVSSAPSAPLPAAAATEPHSSPVSAAAAPAMSVSAPAATASSLTAPAAEAATAPAAAVSSSAGVAAGVSSSASATAAAVAPSATATAAPPSPAAPASPTPAAAPSDTVGFAPKPKSPSDPPAAAPPIVATVTALKETVPNAYLITLDNGQVWRQDVPQRYPLEAGQRVTLSRTKWGVAYRLSAEGLHGFIQVERVR